MNNRVIFIQSFLLLLVTTTAWAQTPPSLKYGGKNKADVIEMSNMRGSVSGMTCWKKPDIYIGVIVKRDYDEDEMTVTSFVFKSSNDKRMAININQEQVGLLGHYAVSSVASVLTQGQLVKVWSYDCTGGGSGIFKYVDRVQWIAEPKRSLKRISKRRS